MTMTEEVLDIWNKYRACTWYMDPHGTA